MSDTATYTHTATIRGHVRNVPVRKDGHYWWCAYEVDYGIVWGPRDVTDVRPIEAAS
jgi:hypothetical protein